VSAIGQASRPELVDWGIDIDDSGRTNLAYVYAGGDVVNGGASVVQAVAEGRRAARAIEEDLCAT
jgi:NADPH-dependent glutamate synthase beta subunit-like oxidoreductase